MIKELSGSSQQNDSPELQRLAKSFKRIIADKQQRLVIQWPNIFDKTDQWWLQTRTKVFHENKKPIWLFSVLLILGLISILHPIASLFAAKSDFALPGFWNELIKVNFNPIQGIGSVERLRLAGEAVIGGLLVFSAGAGFFGATKLGATVASISLLGLIVLVNLLVFFFDQFSAIFFTNIQFAALFFTRQYRLLLKNWFFTK
ncbi:MAG: hypothetical protein Q8N39_09375 [Pelolinea sp.]|nr:hypothetical protein [Pelolinea sp.]